MPPVKKLTLLVVAVLLVACESGSNNRPVPSVAVIGGDLKCAAGDHGYEDPQAGWGFCYPGTWKYNERAQGSASPSGLDLTFDITDIPCVEVSIPPGQPSVRPTCSPNAGLFAFMIISTYQRGDATSLASWVQANLKPVPALNPIPWGDAIDAAKLADGRRIALTMHHIVILDLHSGAGHLDLETEMSSRLDTWKFSY